MNLSPADRNRPSENQPEEQGNKVSPSGLTIPAHLCARMTFEETLIPDDLKAYPHWVMWSYDLNEKKKWTKVPLYVNERGQLRRSASNDPNRWMPYSFAVEQARIHGLGISFMTSNDPVYGDPFVFVDIDLPPDHPEVTELILRLGTYTEASPSGQGVRMVLRGQKPTRRCRRGPYEVYDTLQPLTITGNQIPGTNLLIAEAGDEFDQFFASYIDQGESAQEPVDLTHFHVSDAATTIEEILQRAAQSGPMGQRLIELFKHGQATGYTQNDEHVRDLHFMVLAAEHTGANPALLDAFFRASAVAQIEGRLQKWNRTSTGGRLYGVNTIEQAITRAARNQKQRPPEQKYAALDPAFSDSPVHELPS